MLPGSRRWLNRPLARRSEKYMRQINPYMAAARRSGEPDENAARQRTASAGAKNCITDVKKFRLHYGDVPVGVVVMARPMEVHAWNKNARAYYAHQLTLGRDMLPILEWREVGKASESVVWRVKFRNNTNDGEMLVSALSKAGAKREFDQMAPVTAVIKSIEKDDDVEAAVAAARAMNEQSAFAEETTTVEEPESKT